MKLGKFLVAAVGVGAAIGGAIVYLKEKGYVTFNFNKDCCCDGDCDCGDDCDCHEGALSREYIHVDTEAMREKAADIAKDVKEKAGDFYEDAKKVAEKATDNLASAVEKTWYETPEMVSSFKNSASSVAKETVEKVEDFFNDEEN